MVEIGDVVEFVDEVAVPHKAIVTTTFTAGHPGDDGPQPAVNLVYVSTDASATDQYGRQIERRTSVVNEKYQAAHGFFWREIA